MEEPPSTLDVKEMFAEVCDGEREATSCLKSALGNFDKINAKVGDSIKIQNETDKSFTSEDLRQEESSNQENNTSNNSTSTPHALSSTTTNYHLDIVNLVQTELHCFICQEIMRKPCVCPTCGNFVGCKECLAQSHVSLNEVRDANDYEPVDPMCPYCRENSIPFHPIELRAMNDVIQKLRECAILN